MTRRRALAIVAAVALELLASGCVATSTCDDDCPVSPSATEIVEAGKVCPAGCYADGHLNTHPSDPTAQGLAPADGDGGPDASAESEVAP